LAWRWGLAKRWCQKKHWDMTHFQTAILQQYSSHVGSGFSVRSLEFSWRLSTKSS
jgi:hypothetical protein